MLSSEFFENFKEQLFNKISPDDCFYHQSLKTDCIKRAQLWSFSGPYFKVFGLKTNTSRDGPEKLHNNEVTELPRRHVSVLCTPSCGSLSTD